MCLDNLAGPKTVTVAPWSRNVHIYAGNKPSVWLGYNIPLNSAAAEAEPTSRNPEAEAQVRLQVLSRVQVQLSIAVTVSGYSKQGRIR